MQTMSSNRNMEKERDGTDLKITVPTFIYSILLLILILKLCKLIQKNTEKTNFNY